MEGIKTLYARTGGKDQVGTFRMNLKDWDERPPAEDIISQVNEITASYAGVEIELRKDENGPGGGKALSIELPRFVDVLNSEAKR